MTAVKWHTARAQEAPALEPLWRDAVARGWIPRQSARVILHVAAPAENAVARETARSLVTFLQTNALSPRIELVGSNPPTLPGVERLDLRGQTGYRVDVACLRDGARIPEAWLDDVFVITITDVAPDPRLGIRAILAAQAALLDAPEALDLDVMFAAHRLLRSSLCIACGPTIYGDGASESWWAVSTDDAALERAIAWQAGAEADGLPVFRHFARHETAASNAGHLAEEAPPLHGYVAPAGRVAFERLVASMRVRSGQVVTDVRRGAQNLYRLPQFVERRMPGVARLLGAA